MMIANKSQATNQAFLGNVLRRMDSSLAKYHPSMSQVLNPVIIKIADQKLSPNQVKNILLQYCFLPEQIVELLETAQKRLSNWNYVEAELDRNIKEELGSRTGGIPHYEILIQSLKSEAGIDTKDTQIGFSTEHFLNTVKTALLQESQSYVLGCIYGLEASAVPELAMVATIINGLAYLQGQNKPLIDLANHLSVAKSMELNEHKYNLNTFFAMHLVDFEVGHKSGLIEASKQQLDFNSIELDELEAGFEYVLNEMDQWWNSLATNS